MSIAATSTATQSSATQSSAGAAAGQTALTSLSSNFQDFLGMLMTQLQNQDPPRRWTPTSSPANWSSSPASSSRSTPTRR